MNKNIFREYDIRGIAENDLNNDSVVEIAAAYATLIQDFNSNSVLIGRDCRLSSNRIFDIFASTLIDHGVRVVDIGIITTPILYFAVNNYDIDAGVMITASHNPPEYNGFKTMVGKEVLSSAQIQKLYEIILSKSFAPKSKKKNSIEKLNVLDDYIEDITDNINLNKKIKLGVDCANTPIGGFVKSVFNKLECEALTLFDEPDGSFPNHHPDPSVESNLTELKKTVVKNKLDFGIAFDGDGDRIGVVDDKGNYINSDIILLILAKSILFNNPGATIIGEVKCSKVLFEEIKSLGGNPIMWKTGHSNIKEKIKNAKAILAGELSGHIFFKDKHYGYDDALYAALRISEVLSNTNIKLSDIIDKIPKRISTPEIRIDYSEENKFKLIKSLKKEIINDIRDYDINEIDGIRIENKNSWALIRASNTQPALTLRFESNSIENLNIIKEFLSTKLNNLTGEKWKF